MTDSSFLNTKIHLPSSHWAFKLQPVRGWAMPSEQETLPEQFSLVKSPSLLQQALPWLRVWYLFLLRMWLATFLLRTSKCLFNIVLVNWNAVRRKNKGTKTASLRRITEVVRVVVIAGRLSMSLSSCCMCKTTATSLPVCHKASARLPR